jgi:hypothetical protein
MKVKAEGLGFSPGTETGKKDYEPIFLLIAITLSLSPILHRSGRIRWRYFLGIY